MAGFVAGLCISNLYIYIYIANEDHRIYVDMAHLA